VAYDLAEADPVPAGLLALNPFGRVLEHDRFTLHETAAIPRYVDAAAGPVLDALEAIAAEGLHLAGGPPSLATCIWRRGSRPLPLRPKGRRCWWRGRRWRSGGSRWRRGQA